MMLVCRVFVLLCVTIVALGHGVSNPVELIQRENAKVALGTYV